MTVHPMLAAGVDLNPIDLIAFLLSVGRYPIGWLIEHLSVVFNGLGFLRSIGPFGLAIVVTTLIIRGLLFPVFRWNIRTQRRVQRDQRKVAPQLNDIRRRYKGNSRKITEETQKVYAEHGVSMFSPMAGCLPLLVQLPVLYGLYWGIRDVIGLDATKTSSPRITFDLLPANIHLGFLWIPDVSKTIGYQIGNCATTATKCAVDWAHLVTNPVNLALLLLPIITGLAYFVQSKMTMQPMRSDMSDTERQMASSMRTIVYFMPLMYVFFCFIWPQGLTLYWATAALVMIGQQFHLMGWGSLRVPPWFPGHGRTTPLSYQAADFQTVAPSRASPTASSNGQNRGAPRRRGSTPSRAPAMAGPPGTGRPPARAQKKPRRRR
ncbi:MAG: membrane protein insertase YidC [Candidatus Dormiibacterota bacterium]